MYSVRCFQKSDHAGILSVTIFKQQRSDCRMGCLCERSTDCVSSVSSSAQFYMHIQLYPSIPSVVRCQIRLTKSTNSPPNSITLRISTAVYFSCPNDSVLSLLTEPCSRSNSFCSSRRLVIQIRIYKALQLTSVASSSETSDIGFFQDLSSKSGKAQNNKYSYYPTLESILFQGSTLTRSSIFS